jgi:molecular chaperone HtpG
MGKPQMKQNDTGENLSFGADVSRLLDIVAHALYSNRDVFLRELISNASDACDRLRYEALTSPALLKGGEGELAIRVGFDPKARLVTVADNGIGMDRQELIDHLGTIAKSGTSALMEKIGSAADRAEKLNLIGQFGVGFYASFMVADKVEVISRRPGEAQAWHWESDGRSGFSVREASKAEAKELRSGRGTTIKLHIDDDSSEYLIGEKLREIIQTYSDHIAFPIYLGDDMDKPANSASALWTRPKAEVSKEQYTEFYKHVTHGIDEPLMTSHWRAEGKIEYSALLFVPTLRPWDLYDPTRRNSLRLYVRRVFITDDCEGLVYPWLRFLRGVIDSEDLPLNISREMLQHNPVLAKIRSGVAKRVLSDLDHMAKEDKPGYSAFWGQFGAVLKEGLYDAAEHRDALLKVVRFNSTHGDGLVSLAEYRERMKPEQDAIYYLSGENGENLRNSPQLEGFRARGIEVLLLTDTIDDFWLQSVTEYDGRNFKSVTKGDIRLDEIESKEGEAEKPRADEGELKDLIAALREILAEDVGDVRPSSRLTDSPVCLIAGDNEVDLRMERVLRIHQNYKNAGKRVLEINPGHALILRLAAMAKSHGDEILNDAGHLLLDQARIIQGEPVPDPAAFTRRMALFMERGLAV